MYPNLIEVMDYSQTLKNHEVATEQALPFYEYYSSRDWCYGGGGKIEDWEACFFYWCKKATKNKPFKSKGKPITEIPLGKYAATDWEDFVMSHLTPEQSEAIHRL